MKDQLKRVTVWCVCTAMVTAFCTSLAFAAPEKEQASTVAGIVGYTQPWEGTVPYTTDPNTDPDPVPDPAPDPPTGTSTSTSGQDPSPSNSTSTTSQTSTNSTSTPTRASSTHKQTSSTSRPVQKQQPPPSSSRTRRTNGGTATSRSSSQAESSSEVPSEASSEESSSSTISLPDVDSMDLSIPQLIGSGVEEPTENNSLLGILAWVLIGVGILIVLIVLFTSAKSGSRKSVGRKRYHRGTYKSKKKHLLDDKYYRKNKYK